MLSFLEKTLCHEKARSRVWSIGPARVQSDGKYDIRANLDQKFIDRD